MQQNTMLWWLAVTMLAGCAGEAEGERVGAAELAITEVTLHDVGLNNTFSLLGAVNDSMEMVGTYHDGTGIHAFRMFDGNLTDLHPSGSSSSWGTAISASGDVGGLVDQSAAVWPAGGGSPLMIDTLGSAFSSVGMLNSSGQAVGTAIVGSDQRAFFWSMATGMVDVGDLGGDHTFAFQINELGQIAGSSTLTPGDGIVRHAFSWQNGVMTELGTLGGPTSSAGDINDNGVVVGYAQIASGVLHACMWIDGEVIDLDPAGPEDSWATGANDSGHVVGIRMIGGQRHATLWRDGGAIDLGAGAGSYPLSISDSGVVSGIRDGQLGFVWSNPVDGPIDLPAPPGAANRTTASALSGNAAVGLASAHPSNVYPDGRAALWTFAIAPPPPDDAIGVIEDAVADSSLAPGEASAAGSKLDAALHQCARGNETAARNQIEAFLHQLQAFINSGRLSPEEGQDLIALANAVLDDLSCP